ncbi:MAG: DUF2523 domain-containing protein [Thiobacillus sp.]|nr:DUF2523 domain-containing protein [Thiobacillus sp.]
MFGRVLSALFSFAGWLFKSAMVKWVFYFALFFFVTEAIELLTPLLPGASAISSAFAGLPAGVWYFLDLFRLDYGVPACLSAAVVRFIIRRIPVIG